MCLSTLRNMENRQILTVRSVPPFKRCAAIGVENVLEVATRVMRQAVSHSFPHKHDETTFEVIHLACGRLTDRVAGTRHKLTGGDVLVVFPGESHGEPPYPDTRGVVYWMKISLPQKRHDSFINLRGSPALGLLSLIRNIKTRCFKGSPGLKRHFDTIIRCLNDSSPESTTAATVAHHIHACLLEVVGCANRHLEIHPPEWKERINAHIDENIAEPLHIEDLARLSGFKPSSFKKIFKAKFGMPPIEYVMRRRIAKARDMIRRNPDRSITDVAMELGFSSSQVFATSFKRYCGKTPTVYRKHSWPGD